MPTNQEIQDSLKPMMRAQELQRRNARMKTILNHAALADEPLTEEEKKITSDALNIIAKQDHQYQAAIQLGYWKRLWLAILGRA